MDDQQRTPPGLANQAGIRTTARVIAVVLLVIGPILLAVGFGSFVSGMDDPMDSGPGPVLAFGAGGLCLVLGLAAAGVGWMGTQASYVAGETMPVVKDSATYLSDGQGLAAIGRTTQPDSASASASASGSASVGPFCRACGTRNDDTAKFCDSCGQSLA